MAQADAGAIAPARAVEACTVALRGCPETRRQWERCDLRGTRNRRRPSCCETLAPLTVLSPGPRLAGTPAKGLKIWDQVGLDLPTHVRDNPQNGGQMPTVNHLLTINRCEYGTIWHYLAPFRYTFDSENQSRKGLMKIDQHSKVHSRFRYSKRVDRGRMGHNWRSLGAQATHLTYSVPHVSDFANAPIRFDDGLIVKTDRDLPGFFGSFSEPSRRSGCQARDPRMTAYGNVERTGSRRALPVAAACHRPAIKIHSMCRRV